MMSIEMIRVLVSRKRYDFREVGNQEPRLVALKLTRVLDRTRENWDSGLRGIFVIAMNLYIIEPFQILICRFYFLLSY